MNARYFSARQSNFELLRITAMLGIILFHLVYHVALPQLAGSGEFTTVAFAKRLLLFQGISTFGFIGNSIFILISGYFLIDKKINLQKQITKILSSLVFGVCFLILLSFTFYYFQDQIYGLAETLLGQEFKNRGVIFGGGKIQDINEISWFLGYYICIIGIAQGFLNKRLADISQNQFLTALVCVGAAVTFAFTTSILKNLIGGSDYLAQVVMGVFLYMTGGYMKKYNPFKDIKIAAIIGVIILAFVFLFLGFYNTTMSNIAKFENGTRQSFTQAIVLTGNISAFIVVVAVSVFELFRRTEIGQNKMINKIASATVMIYIVHDVEFTYSFCRIINWPRLLHQSIIKTVVLLIIITIAIFLYGFCAFLLQQLLKRAGVQLQKLAINKDKGDKL